MPRFLLVVLLLMMSRAAISQTADSAQVATIPTAATTILPKSDFKFSFISEVGYMLALTNTANMRSFFRQHNIKRNTPFDPFVHINAGGRYERLKLLVQLGYGVDYFPPNERDALVVQRTYAGYTGVLLGYDVLNDRNMRLYLNLGAGNSYYDYAVLNRVNQIGVVYPGGIAQYSHAGNIPSLKLENSYWDINLELSQREKRRSSIASVLRLGYRRGWQTSKWKSGPFEIADFPADRISQFYFQAGFYLSQNFRPSQK